MKTISTWELCSTGKLNRLSNPFEQGLNVWKLNRLSNPFEQGLNVWIILNNSWMCQTSYSLWTPWTVLFNNQCLLSTSVEEPSASLLPLALRAPLVSVVHAIDLAALADLTAGFAMGPGWLERWHGQHVRLGGLSLVLLKSFLGCHLGRALWRRHLVGEIKRQVSFEHNWTHRRWICDYLQENDLPITWI